LWAVEVFEVHEVEAVESDGGQPRGLPADL